MFMVTMIKRFLNILSTIVPRTTVHVDRPNGRAYVVTVERQWLGRKHTVEIDAKDACHTSELNLLDLL